MATAPANIECGAAGADAVLAANGERARCRLRGARGHPETLPPMFKLAIFDFDGTLANSFPFFAHVFNDLARRHGFRTVAANEAESYRRLGARDIMRRLGMPARKLPLVAADFIGLMRERRHLIHPFSGAPELLVDLRSAGVELGIVSSNAHDNVVAILGANAASMVSQYACGMSIFGKRAHLKKVMRRSRIDRESAIYIGDQTSDLEAAHAVGIAFGAVSWGYGDFDHLEAAGADYGFRELAEISRLLTPAR
jgi:phosphoglycolate phosphatase